MRCTRFQSRVLASALILAVLALATGATARPPGRPGGPPPPAGEVDGARLESLVEQLGLDEATAAAVDQVLDASRVRGRELRRQLGAAHERMRALLEVSEPDKSAIYAQVDVISGLEAESQKNRLRTLLGVRELLSPEARERLLGLMQMERYGSPRRGPPPPRHPW